MFLPNILSQIFIVKRFFYYRANKTHFHKKGFALGLVLRVRVYGTRKWPIENIARFFF